MGTKYKIIFVGAGVANLVAANRLLDYSVSDFIILEQGDKINNRKCVGETINSCKKCRTGCSTLQGVGGANALHGNKLCYFPASNKISDSFSINEINTALRYLNDVAYPYFDICYNSNVTKQKFNKKHYNSDVLSKSEFKSLIKKLTHRVEEKIYTSIKVSEILKTNDSFLLKTESGIDFICINLVLGTGRSSYKFIKSQFEKIGLKYSSQPQDIGIRIETNKENFSEEYYYQVDPKFKFNWPGLGEGRTFCAHNQGMVVPVKFGNSFFADGAFGDKFTKKNNIALMVRIKKPLLDTDIESWCQEINKYANNSLVIGNVSLNQPSLDVVSKILSLIPNFPTKQHKQLMQNLLLKLFVGENKILNIKKSYESHLTIYAPAIDRQWIVPKLNDDFSTITNNNLYVLGDAIGKSRGFVQAMFSGAIWADRFSLNKNSKTKVEWLNLV